MILRTEALFHNHVGNRAQDDVELRIEIQQLHRRHLSGRTAWICRCAELHDMGVGILLHECDLALTCAIICIVLFRSYNPIPPELVEIYR